ncbi:hypothetical protein Tco_1409850 [Tanacetum coccineum]
MINATKLAISGGLLLFHNLLDFQKFLLRKQYLDALFIMRELIKHRKTVGVEIGRNRKNESKNTLGSSADIGKSHEDLHSFHNKNIVVERIIL